MDRKAWFAVVFSVIGLVGWLWLYPKYFPAPVIPAHTAVAATPTPAPVISSASSSASVTTPTAPSSLAAQEDSLYTSSAEYVFENDTGGIGQVLLYAHRGELSNNVFLNQKDKLPIGTLSFETNDALTGFAMQSDSSKGEVVFKTTTKEGIEVTKTFRLPVSNA
ncbi:MAG: hypothetical protein ABI615_12380, partial [Chthoniobacterales bacterium]